MNKSFRSLLNVYQKNSVFDNPEEDMYTLFLLLLIALEVSIDLDQTAQVLSSFTSVVPITLNV